MVAIIVSLPLLRGRARYYLDKIPPWSIYRMLHGSTFFLNVGVLLSADVHLPVVLEMLKARANPWLKERIEDALHGVNIGANLGEALHRAGHDFPDRRGVQLLRIISGQSGSEENLEAFGSRWMEESVTNLGKASKLILACAISFNGAIILLVLAGSSGMSDALINGMRQ
ncbi:type II secretion system F family protein [Undibacterium arcticum]|uniref:type II secretion system F family protein n=1 Tax=Undibacterium arcticum TaxID=1762892 RepID=UPI00360B8158